MLFLFILHLIIIVHTDDMIVAYINKIIAISGSINNFWYNVDGGGGINIYVSVDWYNEFINNIQININIIGNLFKNIIIIDNIDNIFFDLIDKFGWNADNKLFILKRE